MSIRLPLTIDVEGSTLDPRWQLVERIVTSQCFAKSERLSSFLTCVCELARHGEYDRINEQYIGTTVFGRKPNYDPGVDSIVRSHASRLRHRLTQYFNEEGATEEWTLSIPKGSYLPVFHMRHLDREEIAADPHDAQESDAIVLRTAVEPVSRSGDQTPQTHPVRNLVPLLTWALAAVTLVALLSLATAIYEYRNQTVIAFSLDESKELFWRHLFNGRDQTLVVNADSGLVMLQGVTKQRVTLPMYLNGTYLQTITPSSPSASQTLNLATRRYTSFVDVTIVSKILKMTGLDLKNTRFVYSRDLRPSEIKQGNVIILGTYESTPWVQLFEPGMNFYFRNDLARGVFAAINRNPQPKEQDAYNSRSDDPEKRVYGVVAYRPSLNGSGKVLILEGQSMAGTESAADFVFNDGYLLPFLKSIQRPDGAIPYFELLVSSTSISGESSRLEVVAKRIEDH